jgi:hypothetical protein
MTLSPQANLPDGDYIITRTIRNDEDAGDAVFTLQVMNGCKDWRFEALDEDRYRIHGYLSDKGLRHA